MTVRRPLMLVLGVALIPVDLFVTIRLTVALGSLSGAWPWPIGYSLVDGILDPWRFAGDFAVLMAVMLAIAVAGVMLIYYATPDDDLTEHVDPAVDLREARARGWA